MEATPNRATCSVVIIAVESGLDYPSSNSEQDC